MLLAICMPCRQTIDCKERPKSQIRDTQFDLVFGKENVAVRDANALIRRVVSATQNRRVTHGNRIMSKKRFRPLGDIIRMGLVEDGELLRYVVSLCAETAPHM